MARVVLALLAIASLGLAQPFFECQMPLAAFPPIGGPGDCEAVTATNIGVISGGPGVGVTATPSCGMTPQTLQWAYLLGQGPIPNPPAGGPLPRPLPAAANELRIVIPAGVPGVTFVWEFFQAEAFGSVSFNDGFSVDVVDPATGLAIMNVCYADTSTAPAAPLACANVVGFGTDVYVDGPQTAIAALPAVLPPGAYLSVACWNGTDNAVSPTGAIDDVFWTLPPAFALAVSSPFGSGSIQLDLVLGTPGAPYVTLLTLNQGSFPNGAVAGIDITQAELAEQLAWAAPPFYGLLDAAGGATYIAPPGSVPSGISVYGVSGELDPSASYPAVLSLPVAAYVP